MHGRSLATGVLTCAMEIAVGLCPTVALGQVSEGGEISAYGGTFSARGGIHVSDARGIREIRTEIEPDGTSVGFLAGYNFNRLFGAEFAVVGATNHHKATLIDRRPLIGGSENESNLLFFMYGNGVMHLPVPGRVVPYVSGGVGMLGTVGPRTNLALNYGGGAKLFLSRRVAIRIGLHRHSSDLDDVLTQAVFTNNPLDRCEDLDLARFVCFDTPFTDRLRFTEVTVGLTIQFPYGGG